ARARDRRGRPRAAGAVGTRGAARRRARPDLARPVPRRRRDGGAPRLIAGARADAVARTSPTMSGEMTIPLSDRQREILRQVVEGALQAATEALSQVTRLLALVSAPPLEAATVRRVEVLPLQPTVVMVVVITSTGGVANQRYLFEEPVDPGLVQWAAEYLEER